MGILGEDMQTLIDARRAGPGQISAQCSGTSQLEYCELLDNGDGTVRKKLKKYSEKINLFKVYVAYTTKRIRQTYTFC